MTSGVVPAGGGLTALRDASRHVLSRPPGPLSFAVVGVVFAGTLAWGTGDGLGSWLRGIAVWVLVAAA